MGVQAGIALVVGTVDVGGEWRILIEKKRRALNKEDRQTVREVGSRGK
jgi:hypothetical protein